MPIEGPISSPHQRGNNREDQWGGIEKNAGGSLEWTAASDTIFAVLRADVTIPDSSAASKDKTVPDPTQATYNISVPYFHAYEADAEKEKVISRIRVIPLSYEAFQWAVEKGGFVEYNEKKSTIRLPRWNGEKQIVSTPGDFQRKGDLTLSDPVPERLTFPGFYAEDIVFGGALGWGNFVICAKVTEKGEPRKLTLVDLHRQMFNALSRYPLEMIAQNPYSPYL